MKCPKCKGCGYYPNPKYPNPASWSYAGEPSFPCRKCKQTGFVIGNVKEVLEFLNHLKVKFEIERDKDYLREVNQCIDVIEKY